MAATEHTRKTSHDANEEPVEPVEPAREQVEETPEGALSGEAKEISEDGEAVSVPADDGVSELNDRYLRLAAEFENYKKRTAREWQSRAEQTASELLFELLDIVDNFERALDADHEESAYADGVRLIYDQLQNLLRRREVVPMKAMNAEFDPEVHDALLHIHSDHIADGRVCQVIKQGYEYRGRVLRPAQVAVSRGPEGSSETDSPGPGTRKDTTEADETK